MTDVHAPVKLAISETDYNTWKHHPVTQVLHRYLLDYAGELRRGLVERWEAGTLILSDEKEFRGRVLTCSELAELSFESIRVFYEGEKTENEAEAR